MRKCYSICYFSQLTSFLIDVIYVIGNRQMHYKNVLNIAKSVHYQKLVKIMLSSDFVMLFIHLI